MRYLRFVLIPTVLFLLPSFASASWFPQQSGTTANLSKVFFVNAQTGWAAGDSSLVLRTTDGGVQWVRSVYDTIPKSSEALWFYDSSLGWVADSNGLYKTTDGGVQWQYLQNPYGGHFRDVVYTTPQKGWLSKITGPDPTYGSYSGRLYRSTDGGNNWAAIDSGYGIWKISFADSVFGMLAEGSPGVGLPWRFGSNGDSKRTTDGGLTWQVLPFAPDSFEPFDGIPMYTNVKVLNRTFAWRSSFTLGYALGVPSESGGISKTAASGDTWTRMLNGVDYSNGDPDAFAFALVDTLQGYILYHDILMGTLDGGATWVSLNLPGVKHDICFTDSLNGWIVGDQGLILHTTDGGLGVEQKEITTHLSYPLFSIRPNPFTSFTTLPGHEAERFALYDITGRRVGTYKGNQIGGDLRPGVYFIKALDRKAGLVRIVKVK